MCASFIVRNTAAVDVVCFCDVGTCEEHLHKCLIGTRQPTVSLLGTAVVITKSLKIFFFVVFICDLQPLSRNSVFIKKNDFVSNIHVKLSLVTKTF